jgi:hypothetical protein
MAVWSVKAGEESWNGSWFGTGVASVEGLAEGSDGCVAPDGLVAGEAAPLDPTATRLGWTDAEDAGVPAGLVQPTTSRASTTPASAGRCRSGGDMDRGWTRHRIPATADGCPPPRATSGRGPMIRASA